MTTATFGGVTFDEDTQDGFHLSRLIGWYDAAPVRYDAEPRAQAHGSFRPGRIWRGARVVSVEGSWSGSSMHDAYEARRALASMQADGLESPFTVTDELGTTQALAGLVKEPTMDDQMYSPVFRFSFDVVSADPFRYGEPVTGTTELPYPGSGLVWPLAVEGADGYYDPTLFVADPENSGYYLTDGLTPAADGLYLPPEQGVAPWLNWGTVGSLGRVNTPNEGTGDTFSLLTVTGGLSLGFLLTYIPTGALIRFDRQVPLGSEVTLNPRTGRAVIDGQSDVSGFLTVSDWWSVPPGEDGAVQFAALGDATGTPTLTATTSPAFT